MHFKKQHTRVLLIVVFDQHAYTRTLNIATLHTRVLASTALQYTDPVGKVATSNEMGKVALKYSRNFISFFISSNHRYYSSIY
jgi:hypothetical protein